MALYIKACCRLDRRFPRLHRLWILLWRAGIVYTLRH